LCAWNSRTVAIRLLVLRICTRYRVADEMFHQSLKYLSSKVVSVTHTASVGYTYNYILPTLLKC